MNDKNNNKNKKVKIDKITVRATTSNLGGAALMIRVSKIITWIPKKKISH
jgi:hypothetical protein